MKVAVIIIHGIGVTKTGYSTDFQKSLASNFGKAVQSCLNDKSDRASEVCFKEITWDPIVDENQGRFLEILMKDASLRKVAGVFTAIKTLVMGQLMNFRINFASKFVADILSYKNRGVYSEIHAHIKIQIDTFLSTLEPGTPVTIISHSLGTVVASDYIYDRQKDMGKFAQNHELWNLFTMGSPLALFSLAVGKEVFNKPIHMDHPNGRWVNIFDEDDLIAFKLKILNKEYEVAVFRDMNINVGGLASAHTAYWRNKETLNAIARKLAADWLSTNRLVDSKSEWQIYENYGKCCGEIA